MKIILFKDLWKLSIKDQEIYAIHPLIPWGFMLPKMFNYKATLHFSFLTSNLNSLHCADAKQKRA